MNTPNSAGMTQQFGRYVDKHHADSQAGKCSKCGRKDGDSFVRYMGAFGFVFVTLWLADMLPTVNEKMHEHPIDASIFAAGLDMVLHSWPIGVMIASVAMITPKGFNSIVVAIGSIRNKKNNGE